MITDSVSPIWGEVLGQLVSNRGLVDGLVGAIAAARSKGQFSFAARGELITQVEKMGYSRAAAADLVNQSVSTLYYQLSLQANNGEIAS